MSEYRFRVSDSLNVPLRGHMLRLRLLEGTPKMKDLGVGTRLQVVGPEGAARVVEIIGHATPSGRASQQRLERTRELDVVITAADAVRDALPIDVGWVASGPVHDDES